MRESSLRISIMGKEYLNIVMERSMKETSIWDKDPVTANTPIKLAIFTKDLG